MKSWLPYFNFILALFLFIGCASPSHATSLKLFGMSEERSRDLSSFPKWTGVLKREPQTRRAKCSDGGCIQKNWMEINRDLLIKDQTVASLRKVNDRFNRVPYIQDIVNWGTNDFWASPLQFLIRNGDCEDYAIAKYMALRQQGWPADSMRIVILQDQNLRALHAILAVELGGKTYILDNQITQLLTDRQIYHYRPIYSVNETTWWRHNS